MALLTARQIANINITRSAIVGRLYYGDDGITYQGLSDRTLEPYQPAEKSSFIPVTSNAETTVQKAIELASDIAEQALNAAITGSGTVTNVSAGSLSPLFTTSVATPTTTPSISFTQVSQAQNLFYASPNGSAGNPSFRAIVAADLPGGTGTVTSVSVVSANGFAGTVATATTTPAITLTTSVTGVLKGNGTAISAATDTDITGRLLTGYVSGAGVVSSLDSILQGIQKLNGNIGTLVTGVSSVNSLTGAVALTGTANRVTISAANVFDISSSYVGQSSLTTVGTITTGTWNGAAIANSFLANSSITINGTSVALGGSATVTAAAGTLTGTILNSTVVASSLTSVGTLVNLTVTNPIAGSVTGNAATVTTNANLTGPITSVGNATSVAAQTGTGSTFVMSVSPTITTAVLGSSTATTQAPSDNSTRLATTAYVDNAVLGQRAKEAVKYASTAVLPSIIYANGSSGVGATLTGVALAAISLDGSSPSINDRVLIKNQASTFQNGIYTVTQTGSGIAVFVLTRATDFDQASDIQTGDIVFVTSGSTLATTTWTYSGIDNPVIGTDSIAFVQTAGQGSFSGGNGITITGTSIAVDLSVVVDKTTAQTLTNKTLTNPVVGTQGAGDNSTKAASTAYVDLANTLNLKIASNLSDLNNAATARTNLGIGSLGTLANDQYTLIHQALGSAILEQTFPAKDITTNGTLVSGNLYFYPIWSKSAQTITGIKWYQVVKGSYTADQNNAIGLYTYSGGTLTQVATTGNVANLWQTSSSNTIGNRAFTGTYNVTANTLYFIAILWHSSGTTTSPVIGAGTSNISANVSILDYTNSAKFSSVITAQTNIPSPTQVMSGAAASAGNIWLAFY